MLILFCIFEMFKYCLAEFLFFGKKVKSYIPLLCGIVAFCVFSSFVHISFQEKYLFIYLVTVASFYFALQGDKRSRLENVGIVFFGMTSVYGVIQFFYDFFFSASLLQNQMELWYFVQDLVCILILLIGILIRIKLSRKNMERLSDFIRNKSIFLIVFTALIITFAISLLSYSRKMITNDRYQLVVIIIGGIAYISIGFLGGIAIYIKVMNDKMKELMRNEILLKDMQKKYYEALLEREKETRAYRHDMSNHMVCLNAFAQKGDIKSLQTYLNEMQGEILRIRGNSYKIGNEILDIMTNFYLPQLPTGIHVTIRATECVKIDEMKLCIIYANLLQNAVEELCSNPNREGILNIYFKQTGDVFQMMLENSIFRDKDEKKRLITQKKDKKNHGIGLSNVKSVVEELGGKILIQNDTNLFKVLVELKV